MIEKEKKNNTGKMKKKFITDFTKPVSVKIPPSKYYSYWSLYPASTCSYTIEHFVSTLSVS